MTLRPETCSREYREGKVSRRRSYKCRGCGVKFQVDTLKAVPVSKRICQICNARDYGSA
ncbi:hypothetical protein LCGC14_1928140 [marine sediment metagenome]|uniref:Uncharacterized protein n=1 Tax=marine sediment metagenome TaxID=412755 RepID=A0A0F9FPB1_9ZZZZ